MSVAEGYNFAYLDERTKRMIRRAILKAVAIPGHQVPFGSREMPLPYGWGTGGIQVTAAVIGPRRCAQGDRPGLRRHHQRGQHPPLLRSAPPACAPPTRTAEATLIQTRHRIPETPLTRGPDPGLPGAACPSRCTGWSRARPRRARCTALAEYGLMHVKLYEDIARYGHIATSYDYPVLVNEPLRDVAVARSRTSTTPRCT